jgi:hypothetical protein
MASYIGSGTIDTSGSADGQSGGYINFYPNYSFYNSGTFNSSGDDSATTDAGSGDSVNIDADYNVENTGTITTSGALTSDGGDGEYRGGRADDIELFGAASTAAPWQPMAATPTRPLQALRAATVTMSSCSPPTACLTLPTPDPRPPSAVPVRRPGVWGRATVSYRKYKR